MEAELKESPFKDFKLHDTLFDWSDESIDANFITRSLMGSVSYWNNPEFGRLHDDEGKVIREALEPYEIEKEILFEAGREAWGFTSIYGKPYYMHFLTLMGLLDDQTDITPSIADCVQIFCMSFTYGIKVINLIGSQNAGKSAGSVRICFCCFYIDPEYTSIYVANPFNNTADSTVWGDVLEMWSNICRTHPHPDKEDATYLFPRGFVYRDKLITAVPNIAKAGFIKLQDPKKESKFKGGKTAKGEDATRGLILHVIDEVNEIGDFAYLNVLPNLSSQNFVCLTSQNFKSEDDLGGMLCQPIVRYSGDKQSYADLEVDEDYLWSSDYRSMTLRFDGKRAVNLLAKRVIYSYLFKQEDWDRLAESGMQSDTFFSQARSFPVRGEDTDKILTKSKLSGSQYRDSWFTLTGHHTKVSFCDPSFGGRDKALWGFASFGPAMVKDPQGNSREEKLFVISNHFVKLKFVKDAIYNEYWVDRMVSSGIPIQGITMGSEVSVDDQIAIQCAELNYRYGVSGNHFGYDFSMRPNVVTAMNKFVGFNSKAFDYNILPEGYYMESYKQDTSDFCKDRITELCYLTADLFNTRQFRGGDFCKEAIVQLCRTAVTTVNKKKKAMNKREYKKDWRGISPDDRDTILGLVGMAATCGMTSKTTRFDTPANLSNELKVMQRFRAKSAIRI